MDDYGKISYANSRKMLDRAQEARDEDGAYYLTMDDLYRLPKDNNFKLKKQ